MGLSVRDHITVKTCMSKFHIISCGRGLALLWQRYNTLCSSGFVDDVIFFVVDFMVQEMQL